MPVNRLNSRFLTRTVRLLVCLLALAALTAFASAQTTCREISLAERPVLTLANSHLSLSFDRATGALVSVLNLTTRDEYLKDATGVGNPFRVYAGLIHPYDFRSAYSGENSDPATLGGQTVEAAACRLVDWSSRREPGAGVLTLKLDHASAGLALELTARLPDAAEAVDLQVLMTCRVVNCTLRHAPVSLRVLSGARNERRPKASAEPLRVDGSARGGKLRPAEGSIVPGLM